MAGIPSTRKESLSQFPLFEIISGWFPAKFVEILDERSKEVGRSCFNFHKMVALKVSCTVECFGGTVTLPCFGIRLFSFSI